MSDVNKPEGRIITINIDLPSDAAAYGCLIVPSDILDGMESIDIDVKIQPDGESYPMAVYRQPADAVEQVRKDGFDVPDFKSPHVFKLDAPIE